MKMSSIIFSLSDIVFLLQMENDTKQDERSSSEQIRKTNNAGVPLRDNLRRHVSCGARVFGIVKTRAKRSEILIAKQRNRWKMIEQVFDFIHVFFMWIMNLVYVYWRWQKYFSKVERNQRHSYLMGLRLDAGYPIVRILIKFKSILLATRFTKLVFPLFFGFGSLRLARMSHSDDHDT